MNVRRLIDEITCFLSLEIKSIEVTKMIVFLDNTEKIKYGEIIVPLDRIVYLSVIAKL
jgi:hypothetical protein